MLYYLSKGTEFKKEDCKEYKTIDGALRAAAKDETFTVWDENGKVVGGLTDNVPEEALKSLKDFNGSKCYGGVDLSSRDDLTSVVVATGEGAETTTDGQNGAEQEKSTPETENAENGANTEPEESETIIPQGAMRVTVICDGTLNLRRSADWGNGNICGRASRGQTYYVKAIHTVQGKKMVQTIDDIYLSGQPEHVQLEQL